MVRDAIKDQRVSTARHQTRPPGREPRDDPARPGGAPGRTEDPGGGLQARRAVAATVSDPLLPSYWEMVYCTSAASLIERRQSHQIR